MKLRNFFQSFLVLVLVTLSCAFVWAQENQTPEYGPDVKAFLELCRHEEVELDYQISHDEITRKDFIRSKNRIAIQREMVLKRVKETGEDYVPDYHVVTAAEISQLIEDGMKAIKGAKPGKVIANKWVYMGTANRNEAYYIFERVQELKDATRPRTVIRNPNQPL
jgi:hypothetical protein